MRGLPLGFLGVETGDLRGLPLAFLTAESIILYVSTGGILRTIFNYSNFSINLHLL